MCAESPCGLVPDSETCGKLEEAHQLLETLGHVVEPWSWPPSADPVEAALLFWASELAAVIERRAAEIGQEPGDADLGPMVRWSVDRARRACAIDVVRARQEIRRMQVAMAKAMEGFDALLTPVLTEPPLEAGMAARSLAEDVEAWMKRAFQFAPYTEIFNVTGQPAMLLPLFSGSGGLPIGVQLAGRLGGDAKLLRLARQLEEAAPWRNRRPPEPA